MNSVLERSCRLSTDLKTTVGPVNKSFYPQMEILLSMSYKQRPASLCNKMPHSCYSLILIINRVLLMAGIAADVVTHSTLETVYT